MERLTSFIVDYYVIFIILAVISIFSLIGYFTKKDDESILFLKKIFKKDEEPELDRTIKDIEKLKNTAISQAASANTIKEKKEPDNTPETSVEKKVSTETIVSTPIEKAPELAKVANTVEEKPKEETVQKTEVVKAPEEEVIDTLSFDESIDKSLSDDVVENNFKA